MRVAHRLQYSGTMFSVFFGEDEVVDFDGVRATESYRYTPFFHELLRRGVYLPPSPFEAWFISASHDDRAVSRVVEALPAAAAAAASAKR